MFENKNFKHFLSLSKIMKIREYIATSRNKIRNNLLQSATKIFFCHVPKCAGTALSKAISRQVYPVYQQLLIPTFSVNLEPSKKAARICSLSMVDTRQVIIAYNLSQAKYKYGHGHVYCRPGLVEGLLKQWHFITILRNPIDRWISEYTYNTYKSHQWAKNNLSLEEYLQSEKGKETGESFLRYFSSIPKTFKGDPQIYIDEAIKNLRSFSVVGTIENFGEWNSRFEKVFGKKLIVERTNTSPKREISKQIKSDVRTMEIIAKLCESDMRIYQKIIESDR